MAVKLCFVGDVVGSLGWKMMYQLHSVCGVRGGPCPGLCSQESPGDMGFVGRGKPSCEA